MKKTLFALLMLAAAGCDSKKNVATEYTTSLKDDVTKAHAAADKANAAVADENARTQEAQKAAE
jgi:hypothetical protein